LIVNDIGVESTIKTAQQLLAEESQLLPGLRTILGVLIMRVQIMTGRMNMGSRNSSKPPSSNRFGNGGKGDKGGSGKKNRRSTGYQPRCIGIAPEKHSAYCFFFPSAGHQICGGRRLINF
jgi:hypothetical protein